MRSSHVESTSKLDAFCDLNFTLVWKAKYKVVFLIQNYSCRLYDILELSLLAIKRIKRQHENMNILWSSWQWWWGLSFKVTMKLKKTIRMMKLQSKSWWAWKNDLTMRRFCNLDTQQELGGKKRWTMQKGSRRWKNKQQ